MSKLLKDVPILYLDTETTGFGKADRVVELCMIVCVGDAVLTSFHSMIDPETKISEKAQEVHGISQADVRFAPTLKEIQTPVLEFMKLAPICAHSLSFDARMLSRSIPLPEKEAFCSLALARAQLNLRKNRVMDLANFAEIEYDAEEVHGAYEDCRLLHSAVVKVFGELPFDEVLGDKPKMFSRFGSKALSASEGDSQ